MNVNKLPENVDDIAAFYKNALQHHVEENSTGNFASIFDKVSSQNNIASLTEKKSLNNSFFFNPKAFKIAASVSSIIITSVLVLAGSLAVVTVVYDYKMPNQFKFFKKAESVEKNEVNKVKAEPSKQNKLIKKDNITETENKNLKEEIITPVTVPHTETVVNQQAKQVTEQIVNKIEENKKDQSINKHPIQDNKKVLDELKDDELFK